MREAAAASLIWWIMVAWPPQTFFFLPHTAFPFHCFKNFSMRPKVQTDLKVCRTDAIRCQCEIGWGYISRCFEKEISGWLMLPFAVEPDKEALQPVIVTPRQPSLGRPGLFRQSLEDLSGAYSRCGVSWRPERLQSWRGSDLHSRLPACCLLQKRSTRHPRGLVFPQRTNSHDSCTLNPNVPLFPTHTITTYGHGRPEGSGIFINPPLCASGTEQGHYFLPLFGKKKRKVKGKNQLRPRRGGRAWARFGELESWAGVMCCSEWPPESLWLI